MTQHYHSGGMKNTEQDHIDFGWAVASLPFSMAFFTLLVLKLAGEIEAWWLVLSPLGVVIIMMICRWLIKKRKETM